MAGLVVRTAWGSDETHPTAVDFDIDRDRDLTLYDTPITEAEHPLAVYPAGQWLRIMQADGAAPQQPSAA